MTVAAPRIAVPFPFPDVDIRKNGKYNGCNLLRGEMSYGKSKFPASVHAVLGLDSGKCSDQKLPADYR
jgi:hypothetical protein